MEDGGARATRTGHRVEIDASAGGPAGRRLELLGVQPFPPPSLPDAGATGEVARALAQRRELVRLSENMAFSRFAYDAAAALVPGDGGG